MFHRWRLADETSTREPRDQQEHGDFDWPGIAIANAVIDRHGARPWRMTAADYLAGVRADTDQVPLVGPPQPTPWNTEVAEAMANTGHAVYEEPLPAH